MPEMDHETRLIWSEARRTESEALFKEVFRSSPASIVFVKLPEGTLVEVNDAFLEWSGFQLHEVLGRTTAELNIWVHPEDRDAFIREVTSKKKIRNKECLLRTRNGDKETLLVSGTIMPLNDQPHILTVALKITQEKKTEARLRKALEKEQELRRLKSNFISTVSHEFRNPLGVIFSAAEILEAYFDKLPPQRRLMHLQDIKDAAKQMSKLMDGVLTLEKNESGKMPFRPTEIDVIDFCKRLVDEIHHANPESARIHMELGRLPECIHADEQLLRHALINLLSNAVKYSDPTAPVHFNIRQSGDVIRFEIIDQGIGIPASDLKNLFEPFHRASNVGLRSGSGLGLVIVKKCIDAHGGQLSIESVENEGTTATIQIPYPTGQ